jgi:cytochrome c556
VYLATDDKAKEAVEKLRQVMLVNTINFFKSSILTLCDEYEMSHLNNYIYLNELYTHTSIYIFMFQLKTNTLTIHANDITSVLNDNIKATFDDQQHKIMHEILEHFKIYKADSVETIDRKIEEFDELKVKSIVEIKEQIEKGKREFNAHIERGNDELDDKIEDGINELGEIKAKFRKSVNKLNDKVIKSTDEIVSQIELGKHEFEEGKKEIEAYSKQMLKEINRSAELNYWKNDDMLLQGIIVVLP